MSYFSSISSKGRVTVPQEIRKRLGLRQGDRVEFVIEDDKTVIRPARSESNPFVAYEGMLKGAFPGSVKEINTWVDGMRRDERPRR